MMDKNDSLSEYGYETTFSHGELLRRRRAAIMMVFPDIERKAAVQLWESGYRSIKKVAQTSDDQLLATVRNHTVRLGWKSLQNIREQIPYRPNIRKRLSNWLRQYLGWRG